VDVDHPMVRQLLDVLRIPSVSTGEPDREACQQAASWYVDKVRSAGGTCDLVDLGGNPLVIGELRANRDDAPDVLVYGHYDVQSVGDLDLWDHDPFDPKIEDGRIWARGASDDKGNSWPTIYVACELAERGELGVNVRIFVEGEEEAGSKAAMRWIESDERGADAAIVFDSGSVDARTPAITIGTRGIVEAIVECRTATRDVHSGVYGGSVFNAIHVLARTLEAVLPGPDGLLRDELRKGLIAVSEAERKSWELFPPGDRVIEASGATPLTAESGAKYFERNGFEPSIDITMFTSGEQRTIVPALARCNLSMRLGPGQDPVAMKAEVERLLNEEAPDAAELSFRWSKGVEAASFDPESPPLRLAREAFAEACGAEPILYRLGGSIPILGPWMRRGIQTIVSGFASGRDNIHAPNESYDLRSLESGAKASEALYRRLAELPRQAGNVATS